jgi:hypothetical protein
MITSSGKYRRHLSIFPKYRRDEKFNTCLTLCTQFRFHHMQLKCRIMLKKGEVGMEERWE